MGSAATPDHPNVASGPHPNRLPSSVASSPGPSPGSSAGPGASVGAVAGDPVAGGSVPDDSASDGVGVRGTSVARGPGENVGVTDGSGTNVGSGVSSRESSWPSPPSPSFDGSTDGTAVADVAGRLDRPGSRTAWAACVGPSSSLDGLPAADQKAVAAPSPRDATPTTMGVSEVTRTGPSGVASAMGRSTTALGGDLDLRPSRGCGADNLHRGGCDLAAWIEQGDHAAGWSCAGNGPGDICRNRHGHRQPRLLAVADRRGPGCHQGHAVDTADAHTHAWKGGLVRQVEARRPTGGDGQFTDRPRWSQAASTR